MLTIPAVYRVKEFRSVVQSVNEPNYKIGIIGIPCEGPPSSVKGTSFDHAC